MKSSVKLEKSPFESKIAIFRNTKFRPKSVIFLSKMTNRKIDGAKLRRIFCTDVEFEKSDLKKLPEGKKVP